MLTESLDQPLSDGCSTLHDLIGPQHPGGAKPKPLKSSWSMNELFQARRREDKLVFFLDVGDNTVGQAKTLQAAYKFCVDLEKHGQIATIRPYTITEETLQEDSILRKFKAQQGLL